MPDEYSSADATTDAETDDSANTPAKDTDQQIRNVGNLLYWGGTVGGGAMLLSGLVLAGGLIRDVMAAKTAKSWPQADATVTASFAEEQMNRIKGQGWVKSYSPRVTYSYDLDGSTYEGDRIQFGQPRGSQDRAPIDEFLAGYKVGETVQVYVDPNDPAASVLDPNAEPDIGMGVVATIFIAFGLFAWSLRGTGKKKLAELEGRQAARTNAGG